MNFNTLRNYDWLDHNERFDNLADIWNRYYSDYLSLGGNLVVVRYEDFPFDVSRQ